MTALVRPVLALLACYALTGPARAQQCLVENSDFSSWYPVDGVNKPAQWSLAVGATQAGNGSSSILSQSAVSNGITLQGNANTKVWNFVGQRVGGPDPASCQYVIEFRARAVTNMSPGQFDNCHVGLWSLDAGGSPIPGGTSVVTVDSASEVHALTYLDPPGGTSTVEARVFLSKTGYLDVRSVCVRCGSRFDVLKEMMGRYYSFFQLKGVDWVALSAEHRAAVESAATRAALRTALVALLKDLKDLHIWIVTPERSAPYATWPGDNIVLNYLGLDSIYSALHTTTLRAFPQGSQSPYALVSRLKARPGEDPNPAEYGYVLVCTFPDPEGEQKESWESFVSAVRGLASAPGLVVDVRCNQGGDENAAKQLAEVFADTQYTYARQRYRSGPGASEFAAATSATVGPGSGTPFTKPVVVLTGAVCMSSCEGFVLMMKALPHATLVGLPTRGASGNPAPVTVDRELGVEVYFSRWVRETPTGDTFEGTGILPDVEVAWGGDAETSGNGKGDGTLEAGIAEVASMVAGGPRRGGAPPPPPAVPPGASGGARRAGGGGAGRLLAAAAAAAAAAVAAVGLPA